MGVRKLNSRVHRERRAAKEVAAAAAVARGYKSYLYAYVLISNSWHSFRFVCVVGDNSTEREQAGVWLESRRAAGMEEIYTWSEIFFRTARRRINKSP